LKHIGTQTIDTDRLLLRKYEMTDVDDMFRNWVTDPEASRFWGWKPHENIEETKSLLQGWINDYAKTDNYHWVIVIKKLSEAIGYIYLNEINNDEKSASIHYLVSKKFWNQGIMTEACKVVLAFSFNKIGVTKIHTYHHVENPASGKVMQKSGMHYLETKYKEISDCSQINGDYCFYEITLEDWIFTN
jgi:RimJ/RimL family protein N-acetyltransferase